MRTLRRLWLAWLLLGVLGCEVPTVDRADGAARRDGAAEDEDEGEDGGRDAGTRRRKEGGASLDAGEDGPAQSGIALGAFVVEEGQYAPGAASVLDTYAERVGAMPAVVMWYQDWVHYAAFQGGEMQKVLDRGATPLLTWEPWDSSKGAAQATYKMRAVANGAFDPFIRTWAAEAKRFGKRFYLRFAHEMNGNWYPWGTAAGNPNGNTPADYVAAWRHVHDLFREVGATNVAWVFSPNVHYTGSTPYATLFPGDAYVDWLALDGYNWGTSQPGKSWQSLVQVFSTSYASITTLSRKPLLIAETASTESGGNKAAWIRDGFLTDLPSRFPRVRGVIWFHALKETDWRTSSSPAALEAFRSVVASPLYQGELP